MEEGYNNLMVLNKSSDLDKFYFNEEIKDELASYLNRGEKVIVHWNMDDNGSYRCVSHRLDAMEYMSSEHLNNAINYQIKNNEGVLTTKQKVLWLVNYSEVLQFYASLLKSRNMTGMPHWLLENKSTILEKAENDGYDVRSFEEKQEEAIKKREALENRFKRELEKMLKQKKELIAFMKELEAVSTNK